MKKKIFAFFTLLILNTSCGYQPLYKQNTINESLKINEIELIGDKNLSELIYLRLPITIIENDENLNKLILGTNKKIEEVTKNSKGQITSYRTEIDVTLKVLNKEKQIEEKNFKRDFLYNDEENKFKLKEYQNNIENNLIDRLIEDIINYLNYK